MYACVRSRDVRRFEKVRLRGASVQMNHHQVSQQRNNFHLSQMVDKIVVAMAAEKSAIAPGLSAR